MTRPPFGVAHCFFNDSRIRKKGTVQIGGHHVAPEIPLIVLCTALPFGNTALGMQMDRAVGFDGCGRSWPPRRLACARPSPCRSYCRPQPRRAPLWRRAVIRYIARPVAAKIPVRYPARMPVPPLDQCVFSLGPFLPLPYEMERDDGHAVGSEGQVQGARVFTATPQTLNAAVSAI